MYKEKLEQLKNIISEGNDPYKDDDISMIQDGINTMGEYISSVINMESAIQFAQIRMDAEEFRTYVQSLDIARRHSHNGCLASINLINRLAVLNGLEEIFNIEGLDRTQIADNIIKQVVDEYFQNRVK